MKLIILLFTSLVIFISCSKQKTVWVPTNANEMYGECNDKNLETFNNSQTGIQPRDYCTGIHDGYAGKVKCENNLYIVECKNNTPDASVAKVYLYLGTRYTTSKSGLRLRESASTNSKQVAELPFNSEVKVLEVATKSETIGGQEGRWTKIKKGDKTGWVFGAFLSAVKSDEEVPTNPVIIEGPEDGGEKVEVIGVRYVNARVGLRMRQGPSTDTAVVSNIPFNAKVNLIQVTDKEETISGREARWKKIEFKGNLGYVFGGFLSESKVTESEPE
ncbi:MAG: SH3 domain-containing protein [Leptospira sp.]|nr:SH3 domain-containing protein [Leptospira sp.]